MRRLAFLIPVVFATWSCGPAGGQTPSGVYFWKLLTSDVAFSGCSDDPSFRSGIGPVAIGTNTYFSYRIAADGKTASTVKCTRLDASTCTDPEDALIYDVIGDELTRSETFKNPIQNSTCALQQVVGETFTRESTNMTLSLVSVLSLVDDATSCAEVETDLKNASPNMLGVEGCVITRTLTGELK